MDLIIRNEWSRGSARFRRDLNIEPLSRREHIRRPPEQATGPWARPASDPLADPRNEPWLANMSPGRHHPKKKTETTKKKRLSVYAMPFISRKSPSRNSAGKTDIVIVFSWRVNTPSSPEMRLSHESCPNTMFCNLQRRQDLGPLKGVATSTSCAFGRVQCFNISLKHLAPSALVG